MKVMRISAFSLNNAGGNPAGVVIGDSMPSEPDMQAIAKDVGYSETAFLEPCGDEWRIRYFAPEQEVPFCGHATIAAATALGKRFGPGQYDLILNNASITVEAVCLSDGHWKGVLTSPSTTSAPAQETLLTSSLETFNFDRSDLDPRFPPAVGSAGANHLLLALKSHETLSSMTYDYQHLRKVMLDNELTTVNLFYSQEQNVFHSRNPFAAGGVYEDPATGAAAAALSGYLRDIGWMTSGRISIFQGREMDAPSKITADIGEASGSGIRISGETRLISASE